jgi:hypothetical protein
MVREERSHALMAAVIGVEDRGIDPLEHSLVRYCHGFSQSSNTGTDVNARR